jgi:hypothetical protein
MEGSPVRHLFLAAALLLATPVLADEVMLQDNAPEKYVVVKGDTLWDISGRFLKDPWRWPEVWNMNREEIRNPHWIYPGDLIVLDKTGGKPRLVLVAGEKNGMTTVKLSPSVRTSEVGGDAVQTIPIRAIHPFLKQPLVVTGNQLDNSARILGTNEERVILSTGDIAYATGNGPQSARWHVYHKGNALIDPDNGALLGYEAEYLGDAETLAAGDPQKIRITRSAKEIISKDSLVPAQDMTTFEFIPRAPEKPIDGRIISAYGSGPDMAPTGRYQTVVINRGAQDGLEPGHVLALYRTGKLVSTEQYGKNSQKWVYLDSGCIKPGEKVSATELYDTNKAMRECKQDVAVTAGPWVYMDVGCIKPGKKVSFDQYFDPKEVYDSACTEAGSGSVQLPDMRNGLVMVYRVFDRVSYALIMQSQRPVYLLDTVRNP